MFDLTADQPKFFGWVDAAKRWHQAGEMPSVLPHGSATAPGGACSQVLQGGEYARSIIVYRSFSAILSRWILSNVLKLTRPIP
jgi:hypothetical protein